MRGYFIGCGLSFCIFLFGCSTTPEYHVKDTDDRVDDLSKTTQLLEKRIDDLSRTISLLVNDGNRLHNEVSSISNGNADIRSEIEMIEGAVKNLDGYLHYLETGNKALDEGLHKEMEEIRKAEIELSNRLEMMKLDIKGRIESAPGH